MLCGHEYTQANLRFAHQVEPANEQIAERLDHVGRLLEQGKPTLPSTIAVELATNPFLRCSEPAVRAAAERVADRDLPTPAELGAFRQAIDPVKLMMAIPVAAAPHAHRIDSVGIAVGYDPYADFFLLDTKLLDEEDPVPGYLGITGKVHDWTVSRAIVVACKTPVILAGGLNPDNVAEGIRQVRPWGVDANTQLNLERGKKDLPKCRAFIENARAAAAQLGL